MIVGIDLGTTNSLISYWTEDGIKIIPNAFNETLTPSVIGIDDNGQVLVGKVAKEYAVLHPEKCASVFKRHMGTNKKFQLGTQSFLPEELSAIIIKHLLEDARHVINEPISEAIISVPAYFNDTQRKATKRAGELAGIKVERMISEPTAAAIAYGFHERTDACFFVFDLGGGTFDVSILEMFEGIMEVRAVAGDNYLGGEDFTNLIYQHFLKTFQINPITTDRRLLSRIWKEAEHSKRQFSQMKNVQMKVLVEEDEKSLEISSSTYEQMCGHLLQRIKEPIERAIRDSGTKLRDIDGVILVGGATKLPIIRTFVSKLFNQLPLVAINPDEVVVVGAGVQAALKNQNILVNELILTDVCPYTLGTNVAIERNGHFESGHYNPIIERNTVIPVSRSTRLFTLYDKQDSVNIQILQGESRLCKDNIFLGELTVAVPSAKAGEESLDVRYTYDINGLLEVEVTVVSTGYKKTMVLEKDPGHMSKEEIEQRLKILSHLKIHPRDEQENQLILARSERVYQELTGRERSKLNELIMGFEEALEKQETAMIKSKRSSLLEQLQLLDLRGEF